MPELLLTRPASPDDLREAVGPLTPRQAGVLSLLLRAAPSPVELDTLAAGLDVSRGRLLVTLRSLQRERLVVAARGPVTGWALADPPAPAP